MWVDAKCCQCGKTEKVFVEGAATEGMCWPCYREPLEELNRQILEDLLHETEATV